MQLLAVVTLALCFSQHSAARSLSDDLKGMTRHLIVDFPAPGGPTNSEQPPAEVPQPAEGPLAEANEAPADLPQQCHDVLTAVTEGLQRAAPPTSPVAYFAAAPGGYGGDDADPPTGSDSGTGSSTTCPGFCYRSESADRAKVLGIGETCAAITAESGPVSILVGVACGAVLDYYIGTEKEECQQMGCGPFMY